MADEEKKSFTVRDRRMFASETPPESGGSDEPRDKPEAGKGASAAPEEKPAAEQAKTGPGASRHAQTQLPEINFATFVFSLNSSALVHLGLLEDPATGQKEKNLPLAKQTIDILGMLEAKTRGNLSQDEENLLKNILYDLRMMYVKENR